jgi:threonine/homoserine efflux transporter RhtA
VVVIGTLAPFPLNVSALRHLPAARVGVVVTPDPPLAAFVAWVVHGDALAGIQIAGGLMVIAPARAD